MRVGKQTTTQTMAEIRQQGINMKRRSLIKGILGISASGLILKGPKYIPKETIPQEALSGFGLAQAKPEGVEISCDSTQSQIARLFQEGTDELSGIRYTERGI